MTTLSRKMIGYALGRTVLASDRPLLAEMAAAGGSASFSDLAVKIVTSRQFRNRSGDEDPGAATANGGSGGSGARSGAESSTRSLIADPRSRNNSAAGVR